MTQTTFDCDDYDEGHDEDDEDDNDDYSGEVQKFQEVRMTEDASKSTK